jgi:NAD(P)H dehydrogenase (quinone)
MQHAVIFCHPRGDSFTASVADAYARAATALGQKIVKRDLYGMGFDPCLKASEMPVSADFRPGDDVTEERRILADCEIFAFVYPLWLNAPPAMLKGYLERVFGFGFAYGEDGHSYRPLLNGRSLISFSSSGAPTAWLRQSGGMTAIQTLFDRYFAELCGMRALGHLHFGGVTLGASEFFIRGQLDQVARTVKATFGKRS